MGERPRRDDDAARPTVDERPSARTVPARPGASERPSAPTSPDLEPPATEPASGSAFDPPADRFEERDELGRGGMGRVIEAHDRALDRPVAVKYMLSSDAAALARFEREARITARLEHPGIVSVHDAGRTADGTPYYVMRRVDGEPLSEVVERRSPRERRTLVPNVLAAADAIAYAHARGVIHRDLKPSNILVGAFGETLVIDWGIARSVDADLELPESRPSEPALTRVGTVAGTPGFMAPEQARGEAIDARVDVYALGTTLFYVLAGELPYTASGATEMIDLAGAGREPEWSRLPADTPSDLRAIVAKAMAARREDRYRDAGELAADLRAYVTGQLVGAHAYGRLEQLWRFVRRHRATVAVALVALAVILIGSVVSIRRIVRERDAATAAEALAEQRRREADDRSDQLLVQKARQDAERDTAAAIAALRRLPEGSAYWPHAAAAAGAAASRGIPSGLALALDERYLIQADPSSRRIALVPRRGTRLVIVELEDLAHRTIAVPPTTFKGTWLDERTMLLVAPTSMAVVDVTTGRVRTQVVSERAHDLAPDGTGAAWIVDGSGQIRRVDPVTLALGPALARDVRSLQAVPGGRMLVESASGVELWTSEEVTLLSPRGRNATYGAQRVALRVDHELCTWNVETTPVAESCVSSPETEVLIGVTEHNLYVAAASNIVLITRNRIRRVVALQLSTFAATPQGFVYVSDDGQITVIDRQGVLRVSARGHAYDRLLQTDGERYLVGTSLAGDLLVWDLARFRPRTFALKHDAIPVGFDDDAIYTHNIAEMLRHDRRTGVVRELDTPPALGLRLDPASTYAIARTPAGEVLLHLRSGRSMRAPAGAGLIVAAGRTYQLEAGALFEIDLDGRKTPIARIEGATTVAVGRHYVVGIIQGRRVCRVRLAGGVPECTDQVGDEPIARFAVADDGLVWTLAGTQLWRWDGAGAMSQVHPGVAFRHLEIWDGEVFAYNADVMLDLTRSSLVPVAIPTVRELFGVIGRRVIGMAPDGEVLVIDRATGSYYPLAFPARNVIRYPIIRGTTIAHSEGSKVWFLELDVPEDPAALRAWLAAATNAIPVGNTGSITWPKID